MQELLNSVEQKISSVQDVVIMEWVLKNWDFISDLHNLNQPCDKIIETFKRRLMWKKINDLDEMDKTIAMATVLLGDYKKQKQKHKRIVLVGKAASGKDYARSLFVGKNFKPSLSYTTRSPRTVNGYTEQNGIDYYFVSDEEFKKMIDNDEFYEYVAFNNWYYGTSNKTFHEADIFIMTPYGISKIKPEDRKQTLIIYFDIPFDVRKERLMQRNDSDSVERRLKADDDDFKDFNDYDIRITNSDF